MKPTLIQYLIDHSKGGNWTGPTENNIPVITYMGNITPVEPFLAQLGIKLNKADKYSERLEHAGMGETKSGGDTSDIGNGISQSQE
jgi:hypothetical protein